jgi:hypothetical protein
MGMMPPNQGQGQGMPPELMQMMQQQSNQGQQGQQMPPEAQQGGMPQGGSLTDPTALFALMGDQQAMQQVQQDPQALQPQDIQQGQLNQEGEQEPPEEIVSYEDAIDAILGLIKKNCEADLNIDLQAKAIASLASAAHQLQQASSPERVQIDMQGQLDQQQMQMQMEKHQQGLLHQQQLHDQTLQHNTANQALKEWQAQQQLQQKSSKQQQDMEMNKNQHDMSLTKQMQEMMQGQEMHDMNKETQASEKTNEGAE